MKAYDKLFSVIDHLEKNGASRLKDIYSSLDITKSTAHRLLSELAQRDYVRRDEETKQYSLGIGFLPLAAHVLDNLDIRTIADPFLENINSETGETVHLAMLVDDHVVYIDKRESTHNIRMYSVVGNSAPVHCTGVGKAIMAFQDETQIGKMLSLCEYEQFTSHTITNADNLNDELADIREKGYALDREEHEDGIICIAAPIRNSLGKVVASISVTTIVQRMDIDRLVEYRGSLISKCNLISINMGWKNRE